MTVGDDFDSVGGSAGVVFRYVRINWYPHGLVERHGFVLRFAVIAIRSVGKGRSREAGC